MPILAVDIGNTRTHFGIVDTQGARSVRAIPTHELGTKNNSLDQWTTSPEFKADRIDGLAFCSVVPERNQDLKDLASSRLPGKPTFQLTHQAELGLPISYPIPGQIGQDRLANAIAAQVLFGTPAVVVDMGTAVTLDVITQEGGYEGGIIAPGVELMLRALHEQTALLPGLDADHQLEGSIGRSTEEAMQIGCLTGFRGMVDSLVEAVRTELEGRGESDIHLIATGGAFPLLHSEKNPGIIHVPDLTLRGLFEAFCRNRG